MAKTNKVISFASFKGGAGRTVTLANVAFQLSKEFRVGCIDFDVEAGSLHEMFEIVPEVGKKSIQHFFIEPETYAEFYGEPYPDYTNKDIFIKELVIDVKDQTRGKWIEDETQKGNLFLIKAEPDAQLNSLFFTGASMFDGFSDIIAYYGEYLNLDYILIDCRSGISGMSLPGLSYSDVTVVFMRWARQHRYGTQRFFEWYTAYLEKACIETKILLVATGVGKNNVDKISGFSENELKGKPIDNIVIPEIDKLVDCETVFGSAAQESDQSYYVELADALKEIKKRE